MRIHGQISLISERTNEYKTGIIHHYIRMVDKRRSDIAFKKASGPEELKEFKRVRNWHKRYALRQLTIKGIKPTNSYRRAPYNM